jgi:hypothetical protein
MSHTSEEFALDLPSSGSRLASFSPLPEESLPVAGLSDIFRESGVPPGFADVGRTFTEPFGEPRLRASTWAATPSTSDLFGPSLIRNSTLPPDDTLSDDLALLLKLSGAEERLTPPPPGFM